MIFLLRIHIITVCGTRAGPSWPAWPARQARPDRTGRAGSAGENHQILSRARAYKLVGQLLILFSGQHKGGAAIPHSASWLVFGKRWEDTGSATSEEVPEVLRRRSTSGAFFGQWPKLPRLLSTLTKTPWDLLY